MDGLLRINKPKGPTSAQIVSYLKAKFSKLAGRPIKVGHAGTLDPLATGLLIVLIGQATKRQSEFMALEKEYSALIGLGYETTTDDTQGERRTQKFEKGPEMISKQAIVSALEILKTQKTQLPPDFSAIKVAGRRAYRLARAGFPVKLAPRPISIYSVELVAWRPPAVEIKIRTSKGFYVRALARDLGRELKVGGHLLELTRTRIGQHFLDQAKKPELAGPDDLIELGGQT